MDRVVKNWCGLSESLIMSASAKNSIKPTRYSMLGTKHQTLISTIDRNTIGNRDSTSQGQR